MVESRVITKALLKSIVAVLLGGIGFDVLETDKRSFYVFRL